MLVLTKFCINATILPFAIPAVMTNKMTVKFSTVNMLVNIEEDLTPRASTTVTS